MNSGRALGRLRVADVFDGISLKIEQLKNTCKLTRSSMIPITGRVLLQYKRSKKGGDGMFVAAMLNDSASGEDAKPIVGRDNLVKSSQTAEIDISPSVKVSTSKRAHFVTVNTLRLVGREVKEGNSFIQFRNQFSRSSLAGTGAANAALELPR